MNIQIKTRFSDKLTFILLCVLVFLCFITGLLLFYYEVVEVNKFWNSATQCIATRDFDCLLEARTEQAISKDILVSVTGAALSIQGVFFGAAITMLYRGISSSKNKELKDGCDPK